MKIPTTFWRRDKGACVKAVDQNNDGSFEMKDVSVLAEVLGCAAKYTAKIKVGPFQIVIIFTAVSSDIGGRWLAGGGKLRRLCVAGNVY